MDQFKLMKASLKHLLLKNEHSRQELERAKEVVRQRILYQAFWNEQREKLKTVRREIEELIKR